MPDGQFRRNQDVWPQVEPATLADRVYQLVRNRILQRQITPGSFVREQEVSGATGVSRTPVREALNRLAIQGFLERVPHRGFRVPELDWEALMEIYPIVSALEVLAGSIAFEHLDAADLSQLRSINNRLSSSAGDGDVRMLVDLNNAFHKLLSDRSGNRRLGELLDQLRSQLVLLDGWYFSDPRHVEDSAREHLAIVDAIEAKRFDEALAMLERNYFRGRKALDEEVSRQRSQRPEGTTTG